MRQQLVGYGVDRVRERGVLRLAGEPRLAGHEQELVAKVKAYLKAGNRETAASFALELSKVRKELEENRAQLEMHEKAYNNNLRKIKNASGKLAKVRQKIQKYDAELKMSRAEAELAKLSESFEFDVTTDFGQIEAVIEDKINLNRAKARVAADMSGEGIAEIEAEEAMEAAMAEDALKEFEIDLGLVSPETADIEESPKQLGQAKAKETEG